KIGAFISPDPIVQAPFFSQSLNRYAYAWNNPTTFIDPSGFGCEDGAFLCGLKSWLFRIISGSGGGVEASATVYGSAEYIDAVLGRQSDNGASFVATLPRPLWNGQSSPTFATAYFDYLSERSSLTRLAALDKSLRQASAFDATSMIDATTGTGVYDDKVAFLDRTFECTWYDPECGGIEQTWEEEEFLANLVGFGGLSRLALRGGMERLTA